MASLRTATDGEAHAFREDGWVWATSRFGTVLYPRRTLAEALAGYRDAPEAVRQVLTLPHHE